MVNPPYILIPIYFLPISRPTARLWYSECVFTELNVT